jgi:diguanylate cyclase (GGDEF)-like protein
MEHGKSFNIVIAFLITFTIVMVGLQEYSFNEVYVIDASSDKDILSPMFSAVSDGTEQRGQSIVSYKIENNKVILDCEIVASDYAWPFCEITMSLHDPQSPTGKLGVDLTLFKYVKVFAEYENITENGIRFYTRSYDEIISSLEDHTTWKYNGLEFSIKNKKEGEPVTIPLELLQVPTWWLMANNIPLERSITSFDKVMQLDLVTGDNMKPGKYKIILDRLEFHGKYFQTKNVYISIIILWLFASVYAILFRFYDSKSTLIKTQSKVQDINKLNQLLNIETNSLKGKPERDALTGAFNRSGILSVFTHDISELSLIYIDIDLFKAINDNYGHEIGDEILVSFSELIRAHSRDSDLLARWGGGAFLLGCPNTNQVSAIKLAENLRGLIERFEWPHEIKLTASFGVADRLADEPPEDFIHRTDKALYAAKARGRNRVIVSKA